MRSLPTGVESVVFDCDGLLVGTEVCWSVAEAALFAAHGHAFGPERKTLLSGRSVKDAAEAMADCFGRPGAGAEPAAELLEGVRKELARGAEVRPGAAELVRRLRGLDHDWLGTILAAPELLDWARESGRGAAHGQDLPSHPLWRPPRGGRLAGDGVCPTADCCTLNSGPW